MGGKKKTKQDAINDLQLKNAALTKDLERSDSRNAELSELRHRLEEQLQAMKEKYETLFEKLAVMRLDYDSLRAAMTHWYTVATDLQRDVIRRGSRRALHDPEFAIIRELIHANGKLDHEQISQLVKTHRDADIRRLSDVAGEFGFRIKFDMVSRPTDLKEAVGDIAKEMKSDLAKNISANVTTYRSKDGKWESTIEVKDIFASAMENIDGDQKD